MNLLLGGITFVLLVVLAAALMIRLALVVVTVECHSMVPTLQSGDRVLVWRGWPTRWLRKGQIVIVWPEVVRHRAASPFGIATPYIKRIAALPGETISTSITDLLESIRPDYQGHYGRDGLREWIVPQDHFFVVGDSSLAAADSRIWGPIPRQGILGLVIMILPQRSENLPLEVVNRL